MKRLAVLLSLLAVPAAAHEWYPPSCCSGKDCRPLDDGDVEIIAEVYRIIATGEVIPFGSERPSPDGHYHRCSWGGEPKTGTIAMQSAGQLPCFWAPVGF